ncbi:hypothetical protein BH23VER1_BH23VER1_33730 [soil metagenome]
MRRSPTTQIAPLVAIAFALGGFAASLVAQDDVPGLELADPEALAEVLPDIGGVGDTPAETPEDVPVLPAEPSPDLVPMTEEAAEAARASNPALKDLSKEEIQKVGILVNEAGQFIQGIRLQEGLANLYEAEQLAPELFQIHNLTGAAYTKMRDFEKARASFERAVQLAPDVFHAQFNLAEIEFVTDNFEVAESEFLRLLEENPEMDLGTRRLLEYKVLVCRLKLDDEAGAKEQLAKFTYLDDTPAYYASNAAIAFNQAAKTSDKEKKAAAREAAQQWLQSARNIYTEQQVEVFLDALVEAGWIETL